MPRGTGPTGSEGLWGQVATSVPGGPENDEQAHLSASSILQGHTESLRKPTDIKESSIMRRTSSWPFLATVFGALLFGAAAQAEQHAEKAEEGSPIFPVEIYACSCLLYTSDAADE